MEYAKEFMIGQKVKVGNDLGIIKSKKFQGRGEEWVYKVEVHTNNGVKNRILELGEIEWLLTM